jgi:pilus assembly protein Flp/PilA
VLRACVRFLKDASAATAIEYGLIAAGVSVAVAVAVLGVGGWLVAVFIQAGAAFK